MGSRIGANDVTKSLRSCDTYPINCSKTSIISNGSWLMKRSSSQRRSISFDCASSSTSRFN